MTHATIEKMMELALGRLADDERHQLAAHLQSGCRMCQQALTDLMRELTEKAESETDNPPDWLLSQAMNLFRWHTTRMRHGDANRIPASLVVDQSIKEPVAGFRQTHPVGRRVLYRAGEYDIDLSVETHKGAQPIDIIGQIMPLSGDWAEVFGVGASLWQGSMEPVRTQTNAFGEFVFMGLPEAIYDIKLELLKGAIDIIGLHAVVGPH